MLQEPLSTTPSSLPAPVATCAGEASSGPAPRTGDIGIALPAAMLVACTALWGISFPAIRALLLAQAERMPGRSSWFFAALENSWRFALAGLILAVLTGRRLSRLTRSEAVQGLGIGIFGGLGIVLQADGLAHTSASVSAFLTQCYALFIPVWTAIWIRRWPSGIVAASCALVVAGAAVLSGIHPEDLRVGRGELETLAAAVCFAGQILWLARPRFAGNDVLRFSIVSFFVMSLLALPVAVASAGAPSDLWMAYRFPAALGLLAILVGPCTLGAYLLMNRWQPCVTATRAGLIYCLEPVFASLLALFLPAVFGVWAGIEYPNEIPSLRLLAGGGLVLLANVLVLFDRPAAARDSAANR